MISKKELLNLLVGLIEVSDYESIEKAQNFGNEVCKPSDEVKVKLLANLIRQLLMGFEYSESKEFLDSVSGKSEEFKLMKLKLINRPAKKNQLVEELAHALVDLEGERVEHLIRPSLKKQLEEARHIYSALSNP